MKQGFESMSCSGPRGVGEYTCRHYNSAATSIRCVFCGGTMRHYHGVFARAAEDSRGSHNDFIGSRVPADTRVLKCESCFFKWATRMSDAEYAEAVTQ